jgi:uncharacterized membrane protein YeaQ/YmgE (transglycosylase-associated protein family)
LHRTIQAWRAAERKSIPLSARKTLRAMARPFTRRKGMGSYKRRAHPGAALARAKPPPRSRESGTSEMAAMAPLFKLIQGLEGFELACFWLGMFVVFFLIGFVLDYLMGRQGFGPYINSALALIGAFVGLYVRYNYLLGYVRYEPYLSFTVLFAAPVLIILTLSFLRTRVF